MVKGVAVDFMEALQPVRDKDLLLRHDLRSACAILRPSSRLGLSAVPASTSVVPCLASGPCGGV
jgi:hypothetical protein